MNDIVHHAVDYITLQEYKYTRLILKTVPKEYENTNSEIDEKDLYELYKLSLDDSNKEWHNSEFEGKLETICDMKILNDMNHLHDNKVNNISEWNLLHDIINNSKQTKDINRHHYPIINVCMNTRTGRAKFQNLQILLDSEFSSKIIIISIITKLKTK